MRLNTLCDTCVQGLGAMCASSTVPGCGRGPHAHAHGTCSSGTLLCLSMASTSVVLPWSTCAMMAMLRMSVGRSLSGRPAPLLLLLSSSLDGGAAQHACNAHCQKFFLSPNPAQRPSAVLDAASRLSVLALSSNPPCGLCSHRLAQMQGAQHTWRHAPPGDICVANFVCYMFQHAGHAPPSSVAAAAALTSLVLAGPAPGAVLAVQISP